jgi:hypothetical protein
MSLRRFSVVIGVVALAGCRDLDRFDTAKEGAFCGPVIPSEFTRKGFQPPLALRLTLDVEQLNTTPGTLTSNDAETGPCAPSPQFSEAPLVVMEALFADPLSLLSFGAAREYNFMAWVDSTCAGRALAVVSLMHDERVEVRLLRPGQPGPPDTSEFGVFQLERGTCDF